VKRDGVVVGGSELGTAIPVDPGEHVVEATAPGKKPWKTSAKVAAGAGEQKVTVGPLEVDPAAAQAAATPPAPAPAGTPAAQAGTASADAGEKKPSMQKTLGFVALGAGVIGLGVGAVTGVMAMSKNKSSTDACPNDGPCASPDAVDANGSAKSLATISTVGFIAGGVLAAAGAVLVISAPSGSPKTGKMQFVPTAGAGSAGLAAFGVF
jgi:hypothetical protein